ncbi:MAG: PQQ-like beta-propeller repeat protein [Campylobacter sp.]|nr:PQQ-like beta-propeller repeat protein [Campylobacter sp.]
MKKTSLLFTGILAAVLISGCGTKRQYFEPENTTGEIELTKKLHSPIKYVSYNGATLKNGNVITKSGVNQNTTLEKNYMLLDMDSEKTISTSIQGELKITDANGNVIFSRVFPSSIVSAAASGNLLAAVSATNHIYLIDIYDAKILMEYRASEISAVDSRIAAPIFLSTIIVYPSLDGKIYIVNKQTSEILRDFVVSSEHFFNNVSFLDVIGETMIAATAKRVISISPEKTTYYDGEIKDVLVNGNDIYIFEKDGKAVKTNLDLNVLAQNYFKFAIFSDAIAIEDKLYIVEKTGYIIKTDLNLENPEIFKFDNAIEDKSFMSNGVFFYDDEYVEFK